MHWILVHAIGVLPFTNGYEQIWLLFLFFNMAN